MATKQRGKPAKAGKKGRGPTGTPPGISPKEMAQGERLAEAARKHAKPQVVESHALMQAAAMALRFKGAVVGFIPTMGSLHEGHLELVREAKKDCDVTVVSIFVNPTQFGPAEDFDAYPRDRAGDLLKLQSVGADLVFLPEAGAMYPEGFQTTVNLGAITQGACGRYRPGHFAGVATVVAKLFNITAPSIAYFGEKDWQQLQVIRRLVRDLNFSVEVVGIPTRREADGLAMSSRNARLTPRDREQAPALYRAIQRAQAAYKTGVRDVASLCRAVLEEVKTGRGVKLQYVEIVDENIQPLRLVDRPGRILVAAHLGSVRLIDNGPIGPGM